MYSWLRRRKPGTKNRPALMVEELESRYCPSSPQITTFSAVVQTGHTVLLSGTVTDSTNTTVSVNFSGVASGTAPADSNGNFQLQTTASQLGTIYAQATDALGDKSTQVQTGLATPAPQITENLTQNPGTSVTLSGHVTANTPNGLTVSITGEVSGTATTDANGNFSLTANAAGLGYIDASAVDVWGQASNVAAVDLVDNGPTFTLSVAQGANKQVTVTGSVSDESPAGLAVTLSGIVAGTVSTASNGSFTYTGPASSLGTINASVTDPWNLAGTGSTQLTNTPPQIVNFQAVYSGSGNFWTFSGQVQDEYAPGLTVNLSGLPSLGTGGTNVTVGAGGWFTYTVQLGTSETGQVSAATTDWWGAVSNTATANVT